MAVTASQLNQLYLAYFGRPVDVDGFNYYTSIPGATLASVAAGFSASPESQALYGTGFGAAQINAIYQNLFNRDAEPAGLTYWAQEVASGRLSPAMAAYGILVGAQNDDLVSVNNKLAASQAFFNELLDSSDEMMGYTGTDAAASARAWLATVDSSTVSLTDAMDGLDEAVAEAAGLGGNEGELFSLTSAKNTVTGTAGDDTIDAVREHSGIGLQVTTLDAFDSIDGGAGNDTLNIYTGGEDANTVQQGTVKNVEVINIFNTGESGNFGEDEGGINAAGFQGATQIWQHGDSEDIFNLSTTTIAGFADQYVGGNVVATDTATSINIELDGVQGGWLDAEGEALDTVNVTGSLDDEDSHINLDIEAGEDVDTVTLNTAVNTRLSIEYGAPVTALDASGSTGGIEFYTGEDVASTTTGSGEDYVQVNTWTVKDDATTAADETVSAVVSTGAGDDEIDVYTQNTGTTTVNAGDGDDEVYVGGRSSGKLTVSLGAGDDEFSTGGGAVAINGTDVIDGGAGTDGLLLSLVGASNIAAFSNFESFDAFGLNKTLDVEILASKNTVTEITTTGNVGAAVLTNLGAGVGFRAVASTTDVMTLTQKTAGAMTITVDVNEDEDDADDGIDSATVAATATNATALTAAFDADFIDEEANTATLNLTGTKAATLAVVSGGAETTNTLNYTYGVPAAVDLTAATYGVLTAVTVTGDQDLVLNFVGAGAVIDDSESSIATINAADFTGDLSVNTADLKDKGSITLGSGVDTVTVDATSVAAGMESISGFEKALATAFGVTASALVIADSDKLVLTGATAVAVVDATADANGVKVSATGVLTFGGAGPTTLTDALTWADIQTVAGEAVVFQYLSDSYVFVDGGTVVKLTGVTGITQMAETSVDGTFILG